MKTTQTASKLFQRYDTYVWKFVCVCEFVTRSALCSSESCVGIAPDWMTTTREMPFWRLVEPGEYTEYRSRCCAILYTHTHAHVCKVRVCFLRRGKQRIGWVGGWCLMTFVENLERARIIREPSQSLFIQGTYDMCIYMKRSVNKSRSFIFFMNNIQLFYILYLS